MTTHLQLLQSKNNLLSQIFNQNVAISAIRHHKRNNPNPLLIKKGLQQKP